MSTIEPAARRSLAETVLHFAESTRSWPDFRLESGVWGWDDYEEVRYAHLHTVLELRAFAGWLRVARQQQGPPVTIAQQALGDAQVALRALQALLAPAGALFNKIPAPLEHPLRRILWHVNETEHYFLLTIANALAGEGEGDGREPTPDELMASIGAGNQAIIEGTPEEAWGALEQTHATLMSKLGGLTDVQVEQPSVMWEEKHYPISFRLWRYGAHLREHTIQVEKTLAWLGVQPSEADLHARQIYAALGEVEAALLGASELGAQRSLALADDLAARYAALFEAWAAQDRFIDAVLAGDLAAVQGALVERPQLAGTRVSHEHSALLHSLYNGRGEMVTALRGAGVRTNVHESAAVGNTERLARLLDWYPEYKSAAGRDGFTPLQLAAYFAQPVAVRLLLEQGADPHVVSKNGQGLQAIHSAVAGRSAEVVALLVDAGAHVHARQADGFTPLAAALQNGDEAIAALLRNAGAVE